MTRTASQKLRRKQAMAKAVVQPKQVNPTGVLSKAKPQQRSRTQKVRSVAAAIGTEIPSTRKFEILPTKTSHPGAIRIRGHEYLQAISSTTASVGTNLLTFYLNPKNFANSRLLKYAELYDKYLFRRVRIHYTSAQPTSAQGQYVLAFDRDFADSTPLASSAGISQYFTMLNSTIANVWENSVIDCPPSDTQDFYYTSDTGYEGRIVYTGQVYMAAVSGSTFTGSVWVEYDIELFDPQIEPPPTIIADFPEGPFTFAVDSPVAFKPFSGNVGSGSKVYFGMQSLTYGSGSTTKGIILPSGFHRIRLTYQGCAWTDSEENGQYLNNPDLNFYKWDTRAWKSQYIPDMDPIDSSVQVSIPLQSGAIQLTTTVSFQFFYIEWLVFVPISAPSVVCIGTLKSSADDGHNVVINLTGLEVELNVGSPSAGWDYVLKRAESRLSSLPPINTDAPEKTLTSKEENNNSSKESLRKSQISVRSLKGPGTKN